MASRSWLVGCGTVVIAGIVVLLIGGGLVVRRVGTVRQDIEEANQRYAALNREFVFARPAAGELSEERFARYLVVRQVVDSAMTPVRDVEGVRRLIALTTLPREVSRVHVEALRRESMSVDEYRWMTRQLYTTIAAELARPDADSKVKALAQDFQATLQQQNGIRVSGGQDSDPFRGGTLDFSWLRVPDATRAVIRRYAEELRTTVNASIADQVFLNSAFAQ
jgi:hypothetical protein